MNLYQSGVIFFIFVFMKKNRHKCIAGLFFCVSINAQVGIETKSPNAVLDVNGITTLRRDLRVGGTSIQKGSSGLNGQVLVSQGEGLPPVWKSLNVSYVEEGQYKLTNTYLSLDQVGITTLSSGVAADGYYSSNIGDDITDLSKGKWVKITALENNFVIKNSNNKINYQFQTGIEMKAPSATSPQNITFTCAVFRNGKLVAVRPDKISSNNNSGKQGLQDYIFTLNYTEQNVPASNQKIEVACRKIDSSNLSSEFTIGRNISNSNTISNAFTLESVFKVDIIEFIPY